MHLHTAVLLRPIYFDFYNKGWLPARLSNQVSYIELRPGANLLTWLDFNTNMDKWLHLI